MKRTALLILAAVLFTAGSVSAESFKRVVLYQDMAYLTTEKTAKAGKVTIDAPAELIRDSVSIVPSKGGTVKSLTIEPKRFTSGKAKGLIDLLAEKKANLEAKKRLQKTFEREIELIFEAAAKDKEATFSRTRVSDALSFIDTRVNALNAKSIALGNEIEKLAVEVKDLEEQLGEISKRQGYEITGELDSDRPVQVSYAVRGGSWKPEYTVYANTAKGEMWIETNALIRQTTGTDWDAEELSVATGRPSFGIQAPELYPLVHRRTEVQSQGHAQVQGHDGGGPCPSRNGRRDGAGLRARGQGHSRLIHHRCSRVGEASRRRHPEIRHDPEKDAANKDGPPDCPAGRQRRILEGRNYMERERPHTRGYLQRISGR